MLLKLVWVICRNNSEIAKDESLNVMQSLKAEGINVIQFIGSLEKSSYLELSNKKLNIPDLAIVLGGDGTVLDAAKNLAIYNIPILSWLLLKGKCRFCKRKISLRYLIVELLTVILFLIVSLVDAFFESLLSPFPLYYYFILWT